MQGSKSRLLQAGPEATEEDRRTALAALASLATEPYGFSVFAAKVAHATLLSIIGLPSGGAELMTRALAQCHEHGTRVFAEASATVLETDDASVINPTPEVADRGQDHDRSSEETRAEGKGSQGPGLCCSCRVYRS